MSCLLTPVLQGLDPEMWQWGHSWGWLPLRVTSCILEHGGRTQGALVTLVHVKLEQVDGVCFLKTLSGIQQEWYSPWHYNILKRIPARKLPPTKLILLRCCPGNLQTDNGSKKKTLLVTYRELHYWMKSKNPWENLSETLYNSTVCKTKETHLWEQITIPGHLDSFIMIDWCGN